MRKIKITESELIKLISKTISEQRISDLPPNKSLEDLTKPNLDFVKNANKPLDTGGYKPVGSDARKDIQSYNDQHGRQPSQLVWKPGQTMTLGSNLFDTGKSTINKNSKEFQTALTAVKSLTPQTTVDVLGGASAVGSAQGYDNNALALRRANNMIKALKESGMTNINFIAKGVVGTNTQYNSPGAKAEQFVKLTRKTAPMAQSKPAIDNTQNVANLPSYAMPKVNPNQGTLRRVPGVNASTPLRENNKVVKLTETQLKNVINNIINENDVNSKNWNTVLRGRKRK
jgi:outer membrane protein OmpA-like peptidoglycan-associated protein